MRNRLSVILILGAASIIGIIIIQTHFILKSLRLQDKQLNQSICIALRSISETIQKVNHTTISNEDPVFQYSNNYYVVNVNDIIDPIFLEQLLIMEFSRRAIDLDFEYGIYDCQNDKMVYGNYIKSFSTKKNTKPNNLPTYDGYVYYFGILFPRKKAYMFEHLGVGYFFSAVLLVVIIFFVYSIVIILKQNRLSQLQKEFINNITHELKTPLTSVILSSEVIIKESKNDNNKEFNKYGRIIKKQSQLLIHHVENMLLFARTESRKYQLKKEVISIGDFIDDVLIDFETGLKSKDGKIRKKILPESIFIEADKCHFRNILYNIIDNAIKYSPPPLKIDINAVVDKGKIVFSIKDNGIGISSKDSRRVFKRFYRVPTGDIHDVKGFGIGLSYVKNIVELHKWKIFLISDIGIGTKIKLIIPLYKKGEIV